MNFKQLCEKLQSKIISSYEQGVSLEDAERLAAEFLYAQMAVSAELKKADLDSRMRKSGVKALRAAVYTDICAKADKKPTETAIESMINMDSTVSSEQDEFDKAEVERDDLERYYNIFREAHVYFRGVAKGRLD